MVPSQPPAELFVVSEPSAFLPTCQCFFSLVFLSSVFAVSFSQRNIAFSATHWTVIDFASILDLTIYAHVVETGPARPDSRNTTNRAHHDRNDARRVSNWLYSPFPRRFACSSGTPRGGSRLARPSSKSVLDILAVFLRHHTHT